MKNNIVEIPDCWDEFNEEQFDFVMQQLVKLMDKKINELDFRLLILFHLMGEEYKPLDKYKEKRMSKSALEERNSQLFRLSEHLDWMFTEKEIKDEVYRIFNFDSVINFIPELDVYGETFYGPDTALMNVSLDEFRSAIEFFRAYSKDKEEDALNNLIATLYRPERDNYPGVQQDENFDGQRRVIFNKHHTSRYANILKRASFYQRYAIYLWFGNCNNFLREGEIEVEGNLINLSKLYKKQSDESESKDDLGWTGLLFRLADEGTFGNIKQTNSTGIYDVMLKLYQWKQESDNIKKQNQNAGNSQV